MVQSSKPWNDTSPGDAGPYAAEDWALMYRVLFNGLLAGQDNRGVLAKSGDGTNSPLLVTVTSPATNQVRVYPGEALVNGRHYKSDAQEFLTISPNVNVNSRIDRIVLRQIFGSQTVRLAVLQGTAAASPVAPTLTQNRTGTFEISLSQVLVPSGFTTISTGLTDERQAAVLVPIEHGGLGMDLLVTNTLAKGKIAAGISAAAYGHSPAMVDWGLFVGDSSQATGINSVDQRPHKLKGPHAATWTVQRPVTLASGTLIKFDSAEMLNPAGYITSLSANLFRLAAGTYLVNGVLNIGNDSTTTSYGCQWWIANNAAPSVYLCQAPEIYVPPNFNNGTSVHAVMLDELLTSTGAEDFGVRFRAFEAAGQTNLNLDGSSGVQYFISLRRIK